jgi:phospholipid-binding lipoprotein MlaA
MSAKTLAGRLHLGVARLIALFIIITALPVHAQSQSASDPLESFNRAVFDFNDGLDRAVIKPVAQFYVDVVPETPRLLFRNFVSNLLEPWNAFNNLLQGKPAAAVSDLARFAMNTFITLGFGDPAAEAGLARSNEDLGQTLGVWGFGSGPYLVLPLLGPSSVRDGIGRVGDIGFDPSRRIADNDAFAAVTALRIADLRASLLPAERLMEGAALDRYSFIRNAYLQRRLNLVYDGNPPEPKE